MAHEIRNPLGIICSSSELILKKARKEESSYTRILEALHEEAKRLSRTVTEFLDYARPKKPNMMDVNVGTILDQVAVFMEPECEKLGVTIDKEFEGDMAAKGDKDLLYRAFYKPGGQRAPGHERRGRADHPRGQGRGGAARDHRGLRAGVLPRAHGRGARPVFHHPRIPARAWAWPWSAPSSNPTGSRCT